MTTQMHYARRGEITDAMRFVAEREELSPELFRRIHAAGACRACFSLFEHEDWPTRLGLFRYSARSDGQIKVLEHDLTALHEAVLAPKYNFGAPIVSASHVRNDGTLELTHDSSVDGRGLDLERSRKVLDYLQRVWRRPIVLTTVNQAGSALELTAP